MTCVCAHAFSVQRIHRDEELNTEVDQKCCACCTPSAARLATPLAPHPLELSYPFPSLTSIRSSTSTRCVPLCARSLATGRTRRAHGSGSCVQAHADRQKVASQLHDACKNVGFFYVRNHGALWPACQCSQSWHSPRKSMWTCCPNGVLYNWLRWNACRSARGAVPGRFEGSSALVQLAGVPSTAYLHHWQL